MPKGRTDWFGPRLPKAPPSPAKDDLADPANGEKVPRCAICGMPETMGNKIIPGQWGYVRWNMALNLCERCVIRQAPKRPEGRRSADPQGSRLTLYAQTSLCETSG